MDRSAGAATPLPLVKVNEAESEESPADTPTALDPIEVTAGKRARSQRETAGSVGALRGGAIEDLGMRSAEDYLKQIPGISFNKEAADRGDFPIRGITTETRFQSTQRATGIYIDDIPMSDPFIPISQPDLNPFDLERIEVLKGPQGTLFGSSGLAGSIRYITRRPELGGLQGTVSGSFSRVAEGSDGPFGGGMLNVPLGERAALRAVAVYRNEPGYIDDVRSGLRDVAGTEQRQGRLQGSWLFSDRLLLTATHLEQSSRQDDLPYADQRERPEHGNALAPSPTRSDFAVSNLVATYDFPTMQLVSSTSRLAKEAHLKLEVGRTLGTAATGLPVFTTADTEAEGWTQELRLASLDDGSPWQWLAGAWFLRYESTYVQHFPTPLLQTSPLGDPVGEDGELGFSDFRSQGTELALFGDLTRRLGAAWEVTAGGRLYRTDLRSDNVSRGLLFAATSGRLVSVSQGELEEQGFNPRVSVTYKLNRNAMLYGLVSRGFRFGGVQLAPPTALGSAGTGIEPTFKSDTLWNHEIGGRTEWFERRLTFDATIFYAKWKDLQITRPDNTGQFNFVQNIASAHSQGLELSLQAAPYPGITLSSAAAFLDARTDEVFETASGEVPPDTRLPGTPKFQIANVLAYETQFLSFTPGIRLVHSHIGPSPNNLFAVEQLGGYDTFDLHAHVQMPALPMQPRVSLGVTNLADVRGVAGAFANPGAATRDFYFITPRTVSLLATLMF